jgi:nucleoside 2-deoxyribosyltransferase
LRLTCTAHRVNLKSMPAPQVFVIAPFDTEGRRVQDTVQRAVEDAGFRVVPHRDSIRPGAELTSSILDSIRHADLIIADLSRQNPNVLYEVGFAHALRKSTILLFNIKSDYSLPSDLAGLQYLVYDPGNLRHLADRVKSETRAFAMQRSA